MDLNQQPTRYDTYEYDRLSQQQTEPLRTWSFLDGDLELSTMPHLRAALGAALLAAASAAAPTSSPQQLQVPAAAPAGGVDLTVEFATAAGDGLEYSVSLNGETWLQSSPVRAYFDHTEYPSPSCTTKTTSSGTDEIGAFHETMQKWKAGSVAFTTAVKVYSALGVAVFETSVPDGATGTNASIPLVPGGWPGNQGNVKPIVAFPAFSTSDHAVGNGSSPGLGISANISAFSIENVETMCNLPPFWLKAQRDSLEQARSRFRPGRATSATAGACFSVHFL